MGAVLLMPEEASALLCLWQHHIFLVAKLKSNAHLAQ